MRHPVLTSAGARALDEHSIRVLGVPGLALMERAALAAVQSLLEAWPEAAARGVWIAAGRGNNGGDGYAMARQLHLAGWPVTVTGLEGELSPDAAQQRAAAQAVGVPLRPVTERPAEPPGVLVDALLGTGARGALRPPLRELTTWMLQQRALGSKLLAVDMPTGVDGESGSMAEGALVADRTVTFQHARLGQFLEPGASACGVLEVADIGLSGPLEPVAEIWDGAELDALLPRWPRAVHKGQRGHVGILAGSLRSAGAAVLAADAALRAGCGLVTLYADPSYLSRLESLPPEVMLHPQKHPEPEALCAHQALVVGPGCGLEPETQRWLRRVWCEAPAPAIFDADGLTALASQPQLRSPFPRCITPHPGEAGRLIACSSARVQADRVGALQRLAEIAPCLLKGPDTLISSEPLRINPTGGPCLATAGSGDVLAGVVGSLLAQGLDPADALTLGAALHGLAGDIAERRSGFSLRASELILCLPEALGVLVGVRGLLRREQIRVMG